jgi:hypothetical protein
VTVSLENACMEKSLQALFREQLQLEFVEDKKRSTDMQPVSWMKQQSQKKEMIQRAAAVKEFTPLEFVHKGKIHFGNVIAGSEEGNSLFVRISSGKELWIDKSQVISVWEELSDEAVPQTAEAWANVTEKAIRLLRYVSPKKINLEEFWKLIQQQHGVNGRDGSFSINSLDLAIYVFQDSKFSHWLNPHSPTVTDDWGNGPDQVAISICSAAQRMAMAILLDDDKVHFKRRISTHGWAEDSVISTLTYASVREESDSNDVTDIPLGRNRNMNYNKAGKGKGKRKAAISVTTSSKPITYLIEGGYRLLDESSVRKRENDIFLDYYLSQVNARNSSETLEMTTSIPLTPSLLASPIHHFVVQRYLRDLELFAVLQGRKDRLSPPKHLAMLLKRCELPPSQQGARELLIRLGKEYSSSYHPIVPGNNSWRYSQQIINLTPWSTEVLASANKLQDAIHERRSRYIPQISAPVVPGKKNAQGVFDYRASPYPAFCIDSPGCEFSDDAFQWLPDSNEILVHVTDIPLFLRKASQATNDSHGIHDEYAPLVHCAQERLMSCYLPSGPMHMLPPTALHALSLSAITANEVLSVAIKIDPLTGSILQTRVFPAWIGPVQKLTIPQANSLLSMKNPRNAVGVSRGVVQSLQAIHDLIGKVLENDGFWDYNAVTAEVTTSVAGVGRGNAEGGAFSIINSLLSLYANATYGLLAADVSSHRRAIPAPVAWEHWDHSNHPHYKHPSNQQKYAQPNTHFSRPLSSGPSRVRRFATQPLRSYVSLLQQRQVKSALRLDVSLQRSACVEVVAQHNMKRKYLAKLLSLH